MTHSEKVKLLLTKRSVAQNKYYKLLKSYKKLSILDKEIDSYTEELNNVAKICPHENHTAEYDCNTGNYDLYEKYWVDVKCHDCGKRMWFYSDEHPDEYRKKWNTTKK